jgi:hypothetical protein
MCNSDQELGVDKPTVKAIMRKIWGIQVRNEHEMILGIVISFVGCNNII